MKKLFAILLCAVTLISLTSCDLLDGLMGNDGSDVLVTHRNQVTKEEFQVQYKQAYENKQPDYTKDFVYTYYHKDTETDSDGNADIATTNEKTQYDADAQIVHIRNQFQNNDPDDPVTEDYYWTYTLSGSNVIFYSSKTGNTETRPLGFDAFWELAHNQVPMVLFPNPNKLYDDSVYYIDLNKDGEKVFTLYSGEENDYSLRQVMFSDTEMVYFTKSYNKEADYESLRIDRYTVSNQEVTINK